MRPSRQVLWRKEVSKSWTEGADACWTGELSIDTFVDEKPSCLLCTYNKLRILTTLFLPLPFPFGPGQGPAVWGPRVPGNPVITAALIVVPGTANYSFHSI